MVSRRTCVLVCLAAFFLTAAVAQEDADADALLPCEGDFCSEKIESEDVPKTEEQPPNPPELPELPESPELPDSDVEVLSPPGEKKPIPGADSAPKLGNYVDLTNYDSLRSRISPVQQSQRGGNPFILTEARLTEIRNEFMYWYFDQEVIGGEVKKGGDLQTSIQASSLQVHKNLNFQLPFYGFRYNYTRVSLNGYLEFSDPPETLTYPLVFPIKDWPKQNDPAFIGIFYSKCRIGRKRQEDIDQRDPGVYFRLERDLQTRTDEFGIEVRERLKWDIRTGVIGSESFEPKHAVIVTWKNVTFAGGISNSLYTTNTFQLVLATDEVFTYAMFNYLDLQWTSHTEAGSDTLKGEGGVPAFVGFNAGNATGAYEYYPYSQMSTLRDLSGRGFANGFKGRHVFRIDEKIMIGTCNKDTSGTNLPLTFAPESGNMLGGTIVNITGPCFKETDKVRCRFDTEEVIGAVVDSNRAVCVMPQVWAEGYIRFEIRIGEGSYLWKGKFFVESPATASEKIFFDDNSVHQKNPKKIRITWEKYNLTTNQNANIQISLWGYRESTIKPELEYIDMLETSLSNVGYYDISPPAYRNRENRMTDDLQFGFIQINLTEVVNINSLEVVPKIWSRPIPLGWYFGPQWERLHDSKWPEYLCNDWLRTDRYLKNFANELPQCPCTLQQALNDKGRFLPDFDCDKDLNPKCEHHKGALHCVRSGSPSLEGSEQQCCYDKNNYLMLTYDQQHGSRPRRSHNLGYLPWNEANKVPTLSQWYHDVIPYYMCCLWQEEQAVGCETLRFERRPSQDCVAYQAPGVAGVFGDPHIITFDGFQYTFNGKGEFVLVRANTKNEKLDVQGRFEQLPMNNYGEVRATQLTSVATQGNSSTVIEVRLRPKDAQWRYRLDVFANGQKVYFDRPSLKFQHFPGVTVYTPTYILNQSEVVIMYDSGAGVEVLENEGYMSCRVYLPWNFINKTRGLFGNWSWDITDDLYNPDGMILPLTTNINDFERLHKDFGIHWMLEDKDDPKVGRALFHREFSRTSSTYTNKTFEPVWKMQPEDIIPLNRSEDIQAAHDLCGDYYQCKYDYAMSLNKDLAHFSKNYQNTIIKMREENQKRIISCGVLETPRFGRKSNFFFVPGTKVMFECNKNFVLIGDQRRTCLPDGRWNTPEEGYTECLRAQEYSSRTAGITSGIVMAVLIPLILVIVYLIWRVIKKKRESEKNEKDMRITEMRDRLSSPEEELVDYSKSTEIN